jgi:hypothetical protein
MIMGSSCFGLYCDLRADSECREGKGCSKINECCAEFCTKTLADYQKKLGPKKATPEKLSSLTSIEPEAVLLALNWQKNTGFNPFVAKEPEPASETEILYAGDEDLPEDLDPEMFEEVRGEVEPVPEPKAKAKSRSKMLKRPQEDAYIGAQFCEKCKGTGKRGRGTCKKCGGTGKAQNSTQEIGQEMHAIPDTLVKGAQAKPISRQVEAGDEAETVVARGNPRGNSVRRVLQVPGGAVPDVVQCGGGDSGGEGLPEANRSTGKASRRQKASRNTQIDVVERPAIFQTSPLDTRGKGSDKKPQVIVDMYNKRIVGVNWPDYPSLMETPEESIVQVITWDTVRNNWVKWVPQLSGDPDELLFKSLRQG